MRQDTNEQSMRLSPSVNKEVGEYGELCTPVTEAEESKDIETGKVSKEEEEDTSENVLHGINTFWALITPVAMTMLITTFVVTHYTSASLQSSMTSYLVYSSSSSSSSSSTSDDASGSTAVGQSLVNALVIIGFVTLMTFALVILYKFNCFKVLIGYILFASAAILGFVGGQLLDIIVNDHFKWTVDWPTFIFILYNFAMVGVISIFYQKGISTFAQHAYLVLVSVILAWQFSMWPEWTTWVFVNMFAVYDLCAVLTPCGPLKCLIGLIQEKQAPMPGLLYEAQIRNGTGAPRRQRDVQTGDQSASTKEKKEQLVAEKKEKMEVAIIPAPAESTSPVASAAAASTDATIATPSAMETVQKPELPIPAVTKEALVAQLHAFYEQHSPEDAWKAEKAADTFFLHQDALWYRLFHKYQLCSCPEGTVCVVAAHHERRNQQQKVEEEDQTIKLGLGDFIFYSVLVGRASMFDFSTFAVTFICIIMGLGGTLFLLSVLHKALPALPISIFLSSIFYFLARFLLVPLVNEFGNLPILY